MDIGRYVAQRVPISVSMLTELEESIQRFVVVRYNILSSLLSLKKFEATVRCCTQNGVRGGSATVHFPNLAPRNRRYIVLKNNKGTDDNRVRKLDYSIQVSKLFYERFIKDEDITLFSPHDVPGLYEAFGMPEFDEMYEKYERKTSIDKKKVRAQTLFMDLLKERAETGRIYIMNIDHCNTHIFQRQSLYVKSYVKKLHYLLILFNT